MRRRPPKEYTREEMNLFMFYPQWFVPYHSKHKGSDLDKEIMSDIDKLHSIKIKKYVSIMETIPDRETRSKMIDEIEEYDKKAEALETKYHDRIKQGS